MDERVDEEAQRQREAERDASERRDEGRVAGEDVEDATSDVPAQEQAAPEEREPPHHGGRAHGGGVRALRRVERVLEQEPGRAEHGERDERRQDERAGAAASRGVSASGRQRTPRRSRVGEARRDQRDGDPRVRGGERGGEGDRRREARRRPRPRAARRRRPAPARPSRAPRAGGPAPPRGSPRRRTPRGRACGTRRPAARWRPRAVAKDLAPPGVDRLRDVAGAEVARDVEAHGEVGVEGRGPLAGRERRQLDRGARLGERRHGQAEQDGERRREGRLRDRGIRDPRDARPEQHERRPARTGLAAPVGPAGRDPVVGRQEDVRAGARRRGRPRRGHAAARRRSRRRPGTRSRWRRACGRRGRAARRGT